MDCLVCFTSSPEYIMQITDSLVSTALFYCCNANIYGFVDLHEEFTCGLNVFVAPTSPI